MSDASMSTTDPIQVSDGLHCQDEASVTSTPSPPTSQVRTKSQDGTDIKDKPKDLEGGRLQFYFDGKIVLELSDKRENGKTWWVPVTQKTYWPPPPTSCSTPGSTVRQESSASFSFSDESSVQSQSSPWLRETRWKNPSPSKRLHTSETVDFSLRIKNRQRCCYQWNQRRRPFRWIEKCHVQPNPQCDRCRVECRKVIRPNVAAVIARLLEKALLTKKMITASIATERVDSMMISPRKRLLRDMEKVRLNDRSAHSSCNVLKKAKALMPSTPLPTHSAAVMAAAAAAVAAHSLQPNKVYDRQSSYSIDSLLNRERQEEAAAAAAAAASCSSSFLRSLLGKTGAASSSSLIKPVKDKSLISHPQRLAIGSNSARSSGSRPLQPPVWLPYSHTRTVFPPSQPPMSSPTATAVDRPGSSSNSRRDALDSRLPRVPSPPICNDTGDDDVPLNLTMRRAREHS